MSTALAHHLAAESARLPLAIAVAAWLFPLGFGVWLVAQLGFERRTAGVLDAIWLVWFCAVQGVFAAIVSLLLLRLRTLACLPIAGRKAAKYLAAALLALAAVTTVPVLIG